MKTNMFTRIFALLLVVCLLGSLMAVPAMAATVEDATIDMDAECTLTIYTYDFTNAAKDGIWTQESYVSTGRYDAKVNNVLGTSNKTGDTDNISDHTNGSKSYGYAIKGVEFSYLKIADPYTYTRNGTIELLYKFDKVKAATLLTAIGLAGGAQRFEAADDLDASAYFYTSDVLNAAMSTALTANSTTVKNALEAYVKSNGGTAMPETNENGHSYVEKLPVGLYLLAQTKVSETVTSTTNPFLVSLPMTNVNGGGLGTEITNGGSRWLYSVTVYPKNSTGIETLEKTVRQHKVTHGTDDITEEYAHNAVASDSDTLDFQIISTLPTITSSATYLSMYSFQDVLSRGMSYASPVKIEWFKNASCKPTELVATWTTSDATKKFTTKETKNADGSSTLKIEMTEAGLAEINTANTSAGNSNGSLYAGYSNYTIRLTYTAKLHSDESVVYGDAGNPNKVVLTWARTSRSDSDTTKDYTDTLVDDCHVYTYGLNLTKFFSDGKTEQELFDDVLFILQNKTDGCFLQAQLNEQEGIWYIIGKTENETNATPMYPVTWQNTPGQLVIKGLEDDDYILTEVQTADSYILLKDNIKINLTATDDATRPCSIYSDDTLGLIQNDSRFNFDGCPELKLANIPQAKLAHNFLTASATVDGQAVVMINDEMDTASTNALATLNVTNNKGFTLPQTGEITSVLLPMIGGLMLGISFLGVAVLMFLKKKQAQ